ncbi:PAS domain S-box protein [Paralimibaculum aggregatum]|uniref:PAS domain S-box protein n=1 Tax=Paralimibaculum aggregatum TaxID=3036245 RepID=A0ABQ6LNY3_9RHOB|nr:PAS domain-containing protein [Limibaculum sp. NKW23]GMG84039.1 PAS domain S-box protein [Limibaculum sp. NKW23]
MTAGGFTPERIAALLLHALPDAVVVSDAGGVIRFWNAGAERIFGFTPGEATGRSLDIIIPDRQRARHWSAFARTMETGESRYGAGDLLSVPALRKDGSRISVQFSMIPMPGPDGGLEGVIAVLRDVTAEFEERKRLRAAR